MAFGGSYTTGTVSLTKASDPRAVAGSGTLWSVAQIEQGDFLFAAGAVVSIASVTDDTHLTLDADWTAADLSASTYAIIKTSWLRQDPGYTQTKVRDLISRLQGTSVIYSVTGSAPDSGVGEDGQFAIKVNASPWLLWEKVTGEWVLRGVPVGISAKGTWSAATTYAVNEWVDRNGTAYISTVSSNLNNQPESSPADWSLLGAKGDTGAVPILHGTSTSSVTAGTGSKSWTTQSGLSFAAGQRVRASTVDLAITLSGVVSSYSGTLLTVTIDDVSGTGIGSNWNIDLSGEKGIQGAQGIRGDTGATGPAPTISGDSTSLVTVGTGAKTFLTQSNLQVAVGQQTTISNSDRSKIMAGRVVSFAGGTLVVNVDHTEGSGSDSIWTISIAGERGIQGVQGIQGTAGQALAFDASGTLANRSTYDNQTTGFAYLVTETSPFQLFVKASNTSADWDGPTFIGGAAAVNDWGSFADAVVDSFDYGSF